MVRVAVRTKRLALGGGGVFRCADGVGCGKGASHSRDSKMWC